MCASVEVLAVPCACCIHVVLHGRMVLRKQGRRAFSPGCLRALCVCVLVVVGVSVGVWVGVGAMG
jgi:hypothetical protein